MIAEAIFYLLIVLVPFGTAATFLWALGRWDDRRDRHMTVSAATLERLEREGRL